MLLKYLSNSFVGDIVQPTYYKLEKSVAAKSIPAVHEMPGRKKLSNFAVPESDAMDHAVWDELLKKYVSTDPTNTIGDVSAIHLVDYKGLAADPKFTAYLETLANAEPTELPEPEQIAFWMNAYNAICISLLINYMRDQPKDASPIQSINEISQPMKPVWDKLAGRVAGQEMSLNQIEHDQLRKVWDEPAVHACIVCASASCPNLRPEAFVGSKVREQMDDQVRQWLKNESKGLLVDKKRVFLSRIFLWFADDFGGWDGLQEWLPKYIEDDKAKKAIVRSRANKVRYFEYSWIMNKAPTTTTDNLLGDRSVCQP